MKYFSLLFTLTKEDYESFENKRMKAELMSKLKPLSVIVILMAVMAIFIDISFLVAFLALMITMIALPRLINKISSEETRKNSNIFGREMSVDFYDDHFETKYLPQGNFKSHTVRHFGFDTVTAVLESVTHFYFIFNTNNILVIPKRVLDTEKFTMIKNLIDNLFKSKYSVI